jgi:hypothetical protein
MVSITGSEFARIARGIKADRDVILKHNPAGSEDESMLWMLLGCLLSYLSIDEAASPCFIGRPTVETYRNAISFVLKGRVADDLNVEAALDDFLTR